MKGRGLVVPAVFVTVAIMLSALACTQAPQTPPPAQGAPAGGAPSSAPAGPALTLKMAMYQPATHMFTTVMKPFIQNVEKSTNGRVKIEVHDSETLGKANEFLDLVQRGVADFAFAHFPYNSATFPIVDEEAVPFIIRDAQGQKDYMENGGNALIIEEFRSKGLDKIASLGHVFSGGRYIQTKKPVKVPSDLKGMKIRASGGMETKTVEAAGGTGVAMVPSEAYEAMERGIIDGALSVHTTAVDWKWMEVAKYMLNLPVSYLYMNMIYNTDSWNKIPAADRPAVETAIKLAMSEIYIRGMTLDNYRFNTYLPTVMTFYTPTAEERKQWQDAMAPLVDQYKQKAGERGQKMIDLIAKYNKL